MTCAIVIPYYQREDGVLRRALDSVFAQSYQDFHVIVVDDASPHSAERELAPLPHAQRDRIRIIHQINAGPGGARNTGLNAARGSEFVALLDSDDVWEAGHLQRAAAAIRKHDAGVFVAAITGGDEFHYHSSFDQILEKSDAQRLADAAPFYKVEDLAWRMVEDWSALHLSCLAMSQSVYTRARFETDLRLAGEDVLFFHDIFNIAKRTILSLSPGAIRGKGANMFHGVGNTEDVFIRQRACVLNMFDLMSRRPGASAAHRAMLAQRKRDVRLDVLWAQRDRVRSGRSLQLKELFSWFKKDPAILGTFLAYPLHRASGRRPGVDKSDPPIGGVRHDLDL